MSYNINLSGVIVQNKVNPDYQNAVQNFKWPKANQPNQSPLDGRQLEEVVGEISKVIFAASQIRRLMYAGSGIPRLLGEVIINLKKGQDFKNSCLPLIENATKEEKLGLWHTFQALSNDHKDIDKADLKCATLFFGISRIQKIIEDNRKLALQNKTAIEASEKTLKNYILIKRMMGLLDLSEKDPGFLEIDEKIAACAAKIERLKNQKSYPY